MKRSALAFFLAFLLGAGAALAEERATDPLSRMIWSMFQMRQGKTLCLVEATPLATVRGNVANQLKAMGESHDFTSEAVAQALWTLYPCPFSPYRAELRPATAQDIEGTWLFPKKSQKLRLSMTRTQPAPAVGCDVLRYYYGGEMKHAIGGPDPCPLQTADDFEAASGRPRMLNWSLLREGRISVTQADGAGQGEEWDIFAVFAPFEVEGVKFQAGDLVAYGRRGKGNEVNAATQFRHLQRLP